MFLSISKIINHFPSSLVILCLLCFCSIFLTIFTFRLLFGFLKLFIEHVSITYRESKYIEYTAISFETCNYYRHKYSTKRFFLFIKKPFATHIIITHHAWFVSCYIWFESFNFFDSFIRYLGIIKSRIVSRNVFLLTITRV